MYTCSGFPIIFLPLSPYFVGLRWLLQLQPSHPNEGWKKGSNLGSCYLSHFSGKANFPFMNVGITGLLTTPSGNGQGEGDFAQSKLGKKGVVNIW